jgi:hypothetical protein
VPLVEAPPKVLARCTRFHDLRPACPRLLPALGANEYRASTFSAGPYRTITAEGGTLHTDPYSDRPPSFTHVVAQSGALSVAFETFLFPREGVIFSPVDGLMVSETRLALASKRLPEGVFLGTAEWNGRIGTLVVVPPFDEVGSIHADHVVFRWGEAPVEYALSLHAWEPFSEVMPTLRAIVESLPPP